LSNPYWQPRPFRPVFNNREELLDILWVYASWYKMGLKDTEISAKIRAKYIVPYNPPRPEKPKKKW